MPSILFALILFVLASPALAVESCLGGPAGTADSCPRDGLWAELRPLNDCRFTFTAGYGPEAHSKRGTPQPIKFQVSGGRCEVWPGRPLNATGTSVQCARSGNGSATVILETSAGVLKKVLAPILARRVPDEPVLEKVRSPPQIEVVALYRSRDFRPVEFGRGCPQCVLLAADIQPMQPGATILDVAVVTTGGYGHWFRCPAAFRCGVPEFSPPDQRNVSGCAGQRVCRVWRLAEDDTEARDTIQITYQTDTATCKNCPERVDYASARRRWEEAKAQAERVCDTFPDRAPQFLRRPAAR